jgi:hypothetical protein
MSDEQDRRGGCNAVRTWLACLGFALASAHAAAAGLNIALTNDDGWDAIGIRVLHEVLTAQGHSPGWVQPLSRAAAVRRWISAG